MSIAVKAVTNETRTDGVKRASVSVRARRVITRIRISRDRIFTTLYASDLRPRTNTSLQLNKRIIFFPFLKIAPNSNVRASDAPAIDRRSRIRWIEKRRRAPFPLAPPRRAAPRRAVSAKKEREECVRAGVSAKLSSPVCFSPCCGKSVALLRQRGLPSP